MRVKTDEEKTKGKKRSVELLCIRVAAHTHTEERKGPRRQSDPKPQPKLHFSFSNTTLYYDDERLFTTRALL